MKLLALLLFLVWLVTAFFKGVTGMILLEKDPERWEKLQEREVENRRRRDERLRQILKLAVEVGKRVSAWCHKRGEGSKDV
jgi:hypothetical protein